VVAAGLYFGRYGSASLTAGARLQQREIWDLIVFLLTGMSFLLVGLELRPILDSLTNRESGSLALEASAVVGVVIVVRFAWILVATAVPGAQRLLGSGRRPAHPWRESTVIGWAGMRGAVSLAASLALPQSFPHRDLLVFLTFAVIVATLVGQGLTLPPLIRRLGLVTRDEQEAVLVAETRRRLTVMALNRLEDVTHTEQFPDEVVDRIRIGYESQLARLDRRLEALGSDNGNGNGGGGGGWGGDDGEGPAADARGHLQAERELRKLVIATERAELDLLLSRRKVSEQVAGGVRAALDIDETTMRP
jgi:CPA1 family monovalent cation:H+ antiporter